MAFFPVQNNVIDHLARILTPMEFMCLIVIIRKTEGWNKASDAISISQFRELTGINREKTISAAINGLVVKKMITVERFRGKINRYRLGALCATTGGKVPYKSAGTFAESTGGKRPTTKERLNTRENVIDNGFTKNKVEVNRQIIELGKNVGLTMEEDEAIEDFRMRVLNEMSRQRFNAMQS